MIELVKIEKNTVKDRGVVLVFSLKENSLNASSLTSGTIVRFKQDAYKITAIEYTKNLFYGGIGDMVGLDVIPVEYHVDNLFRIVYMKEEGKEVVTAFVEELPHIEATGKSRSLVRQAILEKMLIIPKSK